MPQERFTDHVLVRTLLRRCAHGHAQRRRPGVVSPSAAFREPTGTLVPRWRQAPDGGKEGGTQPTESRRINRRLFLAPPLCMRTGEHHYADLKKLFPTLDIGSHSNATLQARLEAGAQRTLEAVACMPS